MMIYDINIDIGDCKSYCFKFQSKNVYQMRKYVSKSTKTLAAIALSMLSNEVYDTVVFSTCHLFRFNSHFNNIASENNVGSIPTHET